MVKVEEILERFLQDESILETVEFGSGHINNTYKIETSRGEYLLQQVNNAVFKKPEDLSLNHSLVFDHLDQKGCNLVVSPIKCRDGAFVVLQHGKYWRLYPFLKGYFSHESLDTPEMAEICAEAFATFGSELSDMDHNLLLEPIPNFHNTENRYEYFLKSIKSNSAGRLSKCQAEVDSVRSFENLLKTFVDLNKHIPKRIVHNDTKINNLMFNVNDQKDYRIIDLDTMTSDFVLFDFGDMIRTGVSPTEEDTQNLDEIQLREDYFSAFTRGFLKGYSSVLMEEEKNLLVFGAQLITFEQTLRFLSDYLQGDSYYKTDYQEHNLVRTRTQIRLLQEMVRNEKKLKKIVSEVQLFLK